MEQSSAGAGAAAHKTYVFVDEYNRHKRLKVMRACDGCRKRKIRCDGALQNGPWPCGACLRLKLKCVPPTLDGEDEIADAASGPGQFVFSTSAAPGGSQQQQQQQHPVTAPQSHRPSWATPTGPASAPTTDQPSSRQEIDAAVYPTPVFHDPLASTALPRGYPGAEYFTPASATAPVPAPPSYPPQRPPVPNYLRAYNEPSADSGPDAQDLDATVRTLSEHMGELAIDLSSAAPYITNEKRHLVEAPAVEEADVILPPSVSSDLTVRIPPEMMPSDERAMDYFGYFFEYVHPYVPVLNRNAFYEQWRTARHSISPLILEGMFACVARYLEEPIEVRKWLALASRHEESFRDVPRVSTIQALMILTKAREYIPKRGYYYRSWMAVKYMTTMAFDLGFHEHLDKHRTGQGCGLSTPDCVVRTRMWQTLFGLEVWVGAPQGRTDFAVEYETVDYRLTSPEATTLDAYEQQTSRRIAFLAQAVQNIKNTNNIWQRMRKRNPDWALENTFTSQNEVIVNWYKNLAPDMSIRYPDDDSPPYLGGDHFVANLHVYHHLIVMIQHRPQLQTLLEKRDPSFKDHLDVCNESALLVCRLHEALSRDFGIHGLQFMQRGIGFTIYGILTCIMMHLASITSPDPVVNTRARGYFTRHMRILEECTPLAGDEVRTQINALREAFSQDTSEPFVLKSNLGLRSPSSSESYPTPTTMQGSHNPSLHTTPSWQQLRDAASSSKAISPVHEFETPFEGAPIPPAMSYTAPSIPSQTSYPTAHTTPPHGGYSLEPVLSTEQATPVWDPSGIFQQWNTAFGAAQVPGPPTQQSPTTDLRMGPGVLPTQAAAPVVTAPLAPMFMTRNTPPHAVPEMAMPTVTPVMWQDAFTNAYVSGHGHKRYREGSADYSQQYSKRRA